MHIKQIKNTQQNQQGFASIVIALVLILVLSLITVGFAQLARREQQTALDKQLAVQANYASESGINDAYQDILNGTITDQPPTPTPNVNTGNCLGAPLTNNTVDNNTAVSYTCVSVNLQPPDQLFNGVSPGAGEESTFSTTAPNGLGTLTFNWASAGTNTTPHVGTGFPQATAATWNSPAVIQVSITPLVPGQTDRNSLINNTFTAYLYPSNGSSTIAYSNDQTTQGQIVHGNCNGPAPYPCSATITSLNGSPNEFYAVHLINYYDTSNISIGPATDKVSGQKVNFVDGQAIIDSTGKAKNVLKRLQVRLPLTQSGPEPSYAVEGQNVCKRFATYPGVVTPDVLPGCSLN